MDLLQVTESGLYCAAGDFHIDPWKGVRYAVTTHAHSDHAREGSRNYLTSSRGMGVLQERLGPGARIEGIPFGERVVRKGVTISLHPAGHILGSAQVRVEYRGEVWVVSGDYKTEAEPTCDAFEPVKCHTFITESTFGLPLYRWPVQEETFRGINEWWRSNQSEGRASVLYAYSLGKAQRVMAGVDASLGPIFVHGAVAKLLQHYQEAGVKLPEARRVDADTERGDLRRCLVITPSSAEGTPWLRRFGEISTGFASGWMRIRGARRRQALDRGFVMSDHADWSGLIDSIRATGASRILVTHGYMEPMVRWLRENGWQADPLATHFKGETAGKAGETEETPPE